jgi:ribosomal protein RSM22 (predicted rRNA methylase)
MQDPEQDLAAWLPRLVAAWRRVRERDRDPEPSPVLSSEERRDLLAGAERLSHGLTRDRELAGARYFEDPQLLGAYLLFYWPVSYAQARSVLGELPALPGDVLDVGAGPAPFSLAALDAGARSALAIDRSRAALSVGEALAGAIGRPLATGAWEPARPLPEGGFDTVVAGHLFNELDASIERRAQLAESLLARVRPGGHLVLVEPALRETSRALLAVRDLLVARGAAVRAPCLWRAGCPALARESDWCHAERRFDPPPLIAELADAAKLNRHRLKMTYVIFEARGAGWPTPPSGHVFRIVSEPLDRKGQHRFVGCGPEGRTPLVLPDKHVSDENRVFVELERGDLVRVDRITPRGDGLRLERGSTVERLARAGEPTPASKTKQRPDGN